MQDFYDYTRSCRRGSATDTYLRAIDEHATVLRETEDTDEPTYRLTLPLNDLCEDLAHALREVLDDLRGAERSALDSGTVAVTDMPDWQHVLGAHPFSAIALAEARPKTPWEVQQEVYYGRCWDTGRFYVKRRQGYEIVGDQYDASWRANHPEE